MRRKPRSARRAQTVLVAFVCLAAIASLEACSLLVDQRSRQCDADADCTSFAGARCDTTRHVCVAASTSSSGSASSSASSTSSTSSSSSSSGSSSSTSSSGGCDVDGGIDGGGCYACAPKDDPTLLNHCTDATCFPFDNKARIDALMDGGKLPPLPKDGGP